MKSELEIYVRDNAASDYVFEMRTPVLSDDESWHAAYVRMCDFQADYVISSMYTVRDADNDFQVHSDDKNFGREVCILECMNGGTWDFVKETESSVAVYFTL